METVTSDDAPADAPEPSERSRRLVRFAAFGAAWVAAVVVMLRPTPHTVTETLPNDLGDPALLSWMLQWGSDALTSDPLSVFDAPIFWPTDGTMGLSDTMLSWAPAYGVIELVVGAPVTALNLFALSLYLLSLVATYLLGRWMFGATVPAVVAALAFTFTSYSLGQQSHIQLLTFGLFPLGLFFLLRAMDRGRWVDVVGFGAVTVGLAWSVATYFLLWMLIVPAVVLALLVFGWRPDRMVLTRGAAMAVVVGVACLPILVLYAATSDAHGIERTYDSISTLLPRDLLTPSHANWLWGDTLDSINTASIPGDHGYMMSLTAYACAAIAFLAMAFSRGRPASLTDRPEDGLVDRAHALWALLIVSGGAFLVALGPTVVGQPGPYRLLYNFVPGFDGLRVTSRFAVVGLLGVALLAALGVAEIIRALRGRPWWVPLGAAALLTVMMMAEVAVDDAVRAEAWDDPSVTAVYDELADRPNGVVLELPIMTELGTVNWPFVEAPRMSLAADDGLPRINGYSGYWPDGYLEDAAVLATFPDPTGLERARELGVRYVVVHTTSPWPPVGITEAWVDGVLEGLPDDATVERFGAAYLVDLGPADVPTGEPADLAR